MTKERQEMRDFLIRACHDFRAPLRAVTINAELLLRAPEQRADLERSLGFLVTGARNANTLVDGLASYALALHVESGPVPVPVAVLLRSALAKLAAEIRSSGAEITYDELPRVTGDADRLLQLLENLLANALRHRGESPPRVHVSAREQEDEWVFAVRDSGPGIEPEALERIFRPFERLRPGDGGAGLGLATCREIVAGHGGRIWAESTPGQGATFYFTLRRDL